MLQRLHESAGEVGSSGQAAPPPRSRRRGWRRRILRLAFFLLLPPLLGWLGFWAAVLWWPYPKGLDRAPAAGTWIEDRTGVPLAAFVGADDQWHMPLEPQQISRHLMNAIVAVEDGRFYSHHGVDWYATSAAAWRDATSLRVKRGASTITMQLQRLRDPRPRTFWNKFEQAVRACQVEKAVGKESILVEYLNRAPFGGNLVGAGAASWRYFGRPCKELSLAEAALLAGLPQSPNRLRPDRFPQKAKLRRDHVLDRMLACGMIDSHQHAEAVAEPLVAGWRELPQTGSGGMSARDAGAQIAALKLGPPSRIDHGSSHDFASASLPLFTALAPEYPGRRITTTIDAGTSRQVVQMAREHLAQLESAGVHAAAVVVLDTPTSECLASVSLNRSTPGLDLTRRPRSTGSTLKPFIYAAAFDAGSCTPATIVNDAATAWPGYLPRNFDRGFRGPMTAAEALAESRNLPAMVVLGQVGVGRVVAVCDAMGLRTLARSSREVGLSLAIGGAECTPLELATAYATLARAGIYRPVLFVRSEPLAGEPRVLRAPACLDVLAALSGAERTAKFSPEAAALRVAWKTGTSSGHRDAWCAAVTPRLTVVVWLGNTGGGGSEALVGAEAAAPLALRLIASLDRGGPAWPVPRAAAVRAGTETPVARWRTSTLVITTPAAAQEIVINPDLPRERQQLALRGTSEAADGQSKLWWFIDDEPVGTATPSQPLWWSPTAGSHQVRLVDSSGHSTATTFRVKIP